MGTIDKNVQKIIEISIEKAVKKATTAIMAANEESEAGQRDYFKATEKLLYSLPALRLKVAQDKETIEELQNTDVLIKEKSKDIVRFSKTYSSAVDIEEEYIQSRKNSMERTQREVQRIERALETVESDEYYEIIPLKYWDMLTNEEIAERLNCDERTVRRRKNRLVNKIKIVLFGADAL